MGFHSMSDLITLIRAENNPHCEVNELMLTSWWCFVLYVVTDEKKQVPLPAVYHNSEAVVKKLIH